MAHFRCEGSTLDQQLGEAVAPFVVFQSHKLNGALGKSFAQFLFGL